MERDNRCAFKDIYEDCPVTCGVCVPILTCIDRTGEWKIGKRKRAWCKWAKRLGADSRCAQMNLNDDCPKTCGDCTP